MEARLKHFIQSKIQKTGLQTIFHKDQSENENDEMIWWKETFNFIPSQRVDLPTLNFFYVEGVPEQIEVHYALCETSLTGSIFDATYKLWVNKEDIK